MLFNSEPNNNRTKRNKYKEEFNLYESRAQY